MEIIGVSNSVVNWYVLQKLSSTGLFLNGLLVIKSPFCQLDSRYMA